jgi:adenylate cyclase
LKTPETSGILIVEIDGETDRVLAAKYGRYPYPPEAYAALVARLAPYLGKDTGIAGKAALERVAFAMPLDETAMRTPGTAGRLGAAWELAGRRARGIDPQGVWTPCAAIPDRTSRSTGTPPAGWAWNSALTPTVPSPVALREGAMRWNLSRPEVLDHAPFGGLLMLQPEADGVVRRIPMGVRVGDVTYPEYTYALRDARGLFQPSDMPPGMALGRSFMPEPNAEDDEGLLTINYAGPTRAVFARVSMSDVLAMPEADLGRRLAGTGVVLVGPTLAGVTPTSPSPFEMEQYPVHTLAHALLMHQTRAYLKPVPARFGWVLAALVALGLGFGLHAVSAVRGVLMTIATAVVLGAGGYGLFLAGHVATVALPLATVAAVSIVLGAQRLAREERRRHSLQRHFTEYLSVDLVMQMMEGANLKLGGEVRVISVMFADLRGFTAWAANKDPLEVISQLNEFLGEMSRIVEDHGGTVDKFIGDEVMAVFGAPAALENSARTALMAALEMQERLADLSRLWEMEGRHPFRMGVSVHTGEAVVGEIGTEIRRSYTAIGSNVNLTKRLEEKTKEFEVGIICTRATMDMAGDLFTFRELGATPVRGITHPVLVYEVVERKGMYRGKG